MAAINGVAEMCMAVVSGYIADKVWGPSRTLQFAQFLGILALTTILIGVWSMNLYVMQFAQFLEGAYMGFGFTCVESVFAQCLRTGDRDWLYGVKFSFEAAGPITGLCLIMILFVLMGNEWDLAVLQWVMTSGLCLNIASVLVFLSTFKPLPYKFGKPTTPEGKNVVVYGNTSNSEGSKTSGYEQGGSQVDDEDLSSRRECCAQEGERVAVDNHEIPIKISSNQLTLPVRPDLNEAGGVNRSFVGSHGRSDAAPANSEGGKCVRMRNESFHRPPSPPSASRGERDYNDESSPISAQRLWTEDDHTKPLRSDPQYTGEDKKNEPNSRPVRRLRYVDIEAEEARGWRKKILLWIPLKYYPYILVLFDVITIFGSGMTVQYFVLFMMKIYDVNPLEMATLNLFNSIIIMGMGILCGVIAQRYGRVRTILPPKLIASGILLWMALARGTRHATKGLMCIAYVLRGALMNCSAGLSRALVMDVVPEHRHGRWNAIESIQSAGWSGTAFLGGFLADRWGYGGAFIVTFCFHITSCAILLPLTVRNDTRLPVLVDADAPGAAGDANPDVMVIGKERQDHVQGLQPSAFG
ncbi:unnamed protein product [Phytomonas sp. EM1]|nr:unnamed protein product [Phytomonas sp. EM1]|eukprot:CCW60674.1 unnamed protein product [Phytomonas sp. isolate EM1]